MAARTAATKASLRKGGPLYAAERIEYNDEDGQLHRLSAGDRLPDDFPVASIARLRKYGAIVPAPTAPSGDRTIVRTDSATGS